MGQNEEEDGGNEVAPAFCHKVDGLTFTLTGSSNCVNDGSSHSHNRSSKSTTSRRQWVTRSVATLASSTAATIAATSSSRPSLAAEASTSTSSATASTAAAALAGAATSAALCDPSVSTFRHVLSTGRERVVHILGTAHISSASAEVAGQLVRDIKPSAVFVELDAKR